MTRALRSSVLIGTVIWLLVVLLVAAIDVSTGPAYDFGFFYLVAVVPAAWLLGRGPGIALALAAGFGWFFADIVEGRTDVIGAIVWNAASRMLLFLTAAWLVDLVRRDRERLRTLDRDRSHFLRVLEHELGGPGHDLAARLHALRDAGGATATELQPLIERAEDLAFLSRDFVALGQLQSGDLWLQHRPVDVAALVEELRARPAGPGPRIPITLSSGSFIVEGDEARLRQAISGLLTEAASATATSDVSIDLRRSSGNAQLTISGGIGPFTGSPAGDPQGPGSVGIALARTIIDAHRGRLVSHHESASRSVRFVVELPLRE